MIANVDDTVERNERLAEMERQLDTWSSRIEQLVAEALEADVPPGDPTRARLDELRTRLDTLRGRLHAFGDPPGDEGRLDAFRSSIQAEWTALGAGLADLL